MKTTIYIDKESEIGLKELKKSNNIFKVLSLSQIYKIALLNFLSDEKIKLNNRVKEQILKNEMGDENYKKYTDEMIKLAQEDWVNEDD